jgi:hypothetical protein
MNGLSKIFKYANYTALSGWVILIVFPFWALGQNIVVGIIISLLCALYTYLVFFGKKHDEPGHKIKGSFWTLKGVIALFKSPRIVLAGWVHYLAFDLMIGVFIVVNAAQYNISHWMLIPCLLMTLMFGPAGLLFYLLLRFTITEDYFALSFF